MQPTIKNTPSFFRFSGFILIGLVLLMGIEVNHIGVGSVCLAQGSSARDARIHMIPFVRVSESVPSSLLSRTRDSTRTLFSMQSGIQLLRADGSSPPTDLPGNSADNPKEDPSISKAKAAFLRGKSAAESGRWNQAVRYLERSLNQYEKNVARLTDFNALVEATLWLARARYGVGNAKQGDVLIRKAVSYRPEYTVDRDNDSPAFLRAFNRIRSAVGNDRAGNLIVTCLVGECMIFVDGVPRGTGTVSVTGLPVGVHYVKAIAPSHTTWSIRVQAPPMGQTRELLASVRRVQQDTRPSDTRANTSNQIQPETLEPFVERGDYRSRFLSVAKKFCSQRRLDYLLAGVMNGADGGHKLALFLYSAKRNVIAPVSETFIAAGAADLQTQLIVSKNRVLAAMRRFPTHRRIGRRPPIYQPFVAIVTKVPIAAPVEEPISSAPVLPPPAAPEMKPIEPTDANGKLGPIVPIYRPQPVYEATTSPGDDGTIYQPESAEQVESVERLPMRPKIRIKTPFTVLERPMVIADSVEGPEWYQTWWFWTAVGAVVVGSVTAGVVLGLPDDGGGGWSATVQLP